MTTGRRILCTGLLTALPLGMVGCGGDPDPVRDDEAAVGAIFVDGGQELPEQEKVYARFEDNSYTFDLDAACVLYYFTASEDVAYAGVQNFTGMTFGADLD